VSAAVAVTGLCLLGALTKPNVVAWAARLASWGDPTVMALSTPPKLGDPLVVLIAGSDSRSDVDESAGAHLGRLAGARADTIIVARISGTVIEAVSVPRDMVVETEGFGPIPLAYYLDLPDGKVRLIHAIRAMLGTPIHHYVEVDLTAFADLIDEVGGIAITIEAPVRDAKSGLALPAGRAELSGAEALAYIRARQIEQQIDGEWHIVSGGDLGRIRRTQQVITELVPELATKSHGEIVEMGRSVLSRTDADAAFGLADLVRVAAGIAPATVLNWSTVPVVEPAPQHERVSPFEPPHIGGLYHLVPDVADLHGWYEETTS
jgi:LCP family protein required for cell wall assembly